MRYLLSLGRYITLLAYTPSLFWFGYGEAAATLDIKRPSLAEVRSAAEPCLPGGSQVAINEKYSCPIGSSRINNGQPLSKEAIECSVQIALSFYEIDEVAKKWVGELQKSREKDMNKWAEDINAKIYGPGGISDAYKKVCTISNWTVPEGSEKYGCALSKDFFPETACLTMAERKAIAYQNIGYILASKGISKSFQNDKDQFLDKQKTAYDGILDKWSFYKRMVGNAVSKFNAYIKTPVK